MKTKPRGANGSAGTPLKSSSAAFSSHEPGPLAVAVGTSNRSDGDAPPKSACQPSLLNL